MGPSWAAWEKSRKCLAACVCGCQHPLGPRLESPLQSLVLPQQTLLQPLTPSGLRPVLSWGSSCPRGTRPRFPSATCLHAEGRGGGGGARSQRRASASLCFPSPLPPAAPQPPPPARQPVRDTGFCPCDPGTLRVRENSCPVSSGGRPLVFTSQRLVSQLSHPSS